MARGTSLDDAEGVSIASAHVIDENPCDSEDSAVDRRRAIAIPVVLTALIVLVAILSAIYVR